MKKVELASDQTKNLKEQLEDGSPSKNNFSNWYSEYTFSGAFLYLLDKFSPATVGLVRWIFLIIMLGTVLVAAINYGTAHTRETLCQWGWNDEKHCEKRPEKWNRLLFP